jgi:ATP adenylyltransferase
LLNLQDFIALWACLVEYDGLAFYNGGKEAGASQPHKHLQLVPYLISPQDTQIPIEPLLTSHLASQRQASIAIIPELPFVHAFTAIDPAWLNSPSEAAVRTLEQYYALLQAVDLPIDNQEKPKPYNLLMTRRWMLLIPRSQESFTSIQVNSLGFAGALLVRTAEQMQQLKTMQPFTLLSQVGIPL